MKQAFCPSCGSERIGSHRFCASCGHEFDDEHSEPSQPVTNAGERLPLDALPLRTTERFGAAELLVIVGIVAAVGLGGSMLIRGSGQPAPASENSPASPPTPATAKPSSPPSRTFAAMPSVESVRTASPAPTPKPTSPPLLRYALTFAGFEYSGNLVADAPYGPDFACKYGTRGGAPLVTFIQIFPSDRHVEQVIFKDDDGTGPANPRMLVILDGQSFIWDRASNIKYEGTAGGTIKYFSDQLGVRLDIDLHRVDDSLSRLQVSGTLRCPPDPYP